MRTEWVIMAAMAAAGIYAVLIFNRLVGGRNHVREAWSGIDVQLRRRADLIPNLVATVKAYAEHERGVMADVTAQRSSSIAATGPRQAPRRTARYRTRSAGFLPSPKPIPG
jgi:LemA protein